MFVWNPYGIPGVLFLVLGWLLGAAVYAAGPGRPVNRRLALLLVLESSMGGIGGGVMYLSSTPLDAFRWQIVALAGAPFVAAAYLWFLPVLYPARTRFLRPWPVRAAIGSAAGAVSALIVVRPRLFVTGVVRLPTGDYEAVATPLASLLLLGIIVVYVFALAASLAAWRAAPPASPTRKKAGLFAIAFGVKNSLFAAALLFVLPRSDPVLGHAVSVALTGLGSLVLIFLAYAILREQVFDIDLRMRWTIGKTTVASAFVATFFVGSELAQQLLGDSVGSAYVGTIAAGALVFALAPLQRLADRVARAAVPPAEDGDAYRESRKREIYRAAYESALDDGVVTDKERTVLATLASELGLSPRDVLDLERAAMAPRGVAEPAAVP